jgi:hypothetical protein
MANKIIFKKYYPDVLFRAAFFINGVQKMAA